MGWEDPRKSNATRHDFHEMLTVAVLSSLCGGQTCVDMEDFAKNNEGVCADSCVWSTARRATTVTTGLKLPKSAEAEFPSQGAANSFRGGACPPERKQSKIPSDFSAEGGSGRVIKLEKIVMLQELKREGLSISAIARRTGLDRKTVRKLLDRGLAAPAYSPREPRPSFWSRTRTISRTRSGTARICPDAGCSGRSGSSATKAATRR